MKKTFLMVAATALLLFYTYGLYQWIQSGHSFNDVWQRATSDWLLAVTLFDLSLFALFCLLWLYRDMSRKGSSGGKKFLILFAALILGVVVLLYYLAFSPPNPLPGEAAGRERRLKS